MDKNMIYRNFANIKDVSVLGLGTVKFGRNQGVKYPNGNGFELPSDQQIEEILDLILGQGVNLIDTAPAYGSSEIRLGQLMQQRRDDLFIVSKTGEEFEDGKSEYIFTKEHTEFSIHRSLKRLKTDRLDSVLVHCNRQDLDIINNTDVLETLSRLKEKGDILSYGMSTNTVEAGLKAVDLTDIIMVAYNPSYTEQLPVIEYANKKGKSIIIKKAFDSGHLTDNYSQIIESVVNLNGVTSIIFGSINPKNILANIAAIGG